MFKNFGPRTQRGSNRYLSSLRELCRNNRKNPTRAEFVLWHFVIKRRLTGYKFLRQKPVDRFILDFYCPKLLLAVEVDGDSHDNRQTYDHERDLRLSQIGIKTIRYTNQQVLDNLEDVYEDIANEIKIRKNEL